MTTPWTEIGEVQWLSLGTLRGRRNGVRLTAPGLSTGLVMTDRLNGYLELTKEISTRTVHASVGVPRWWERIIGIS